MATNMSDSAHSNAYYAQTDNMQAENYAHADFSLSAARGSVRAMKIDEKIRAIMATTEWRSSSWPRCWMSAVDGQSLAGRIGTARRSPRPHQRAL
jgi:hypothetical protein